MTLSIPLAPLHAEQARLVLMELVNFFGEASAMLRLERTLESQLGAPVHTVFPEMALFEEGYRALKESEPQTTATSPLDRLEQREGLFVLLRDWLRRIWTTPNSRTKEVLILGMRDYIRGLRNPLPSRVYRLFPATIWGTMGEAEEPSPLEQALIYLFKVADKTRYCPNPECPVPYFLAQRGNQRYCSEVCAQRAERELKKRWWTDHGKEWRQRRARKSKARRRKKGAR